MRVISNAVVLAIAVAAASLALVAAQTPETYTATAAAKVGANKATREVTISVTHFASEQERAAVIKATKEGAARKTLAGLPDAGVIQVGERKAAIKYAFKRSKGPGSGDLITIATSDPIAFLGSDQPGAASTAGFDVAIAIMDIKSDGTGSGELAPAAKVSIDENGALRMQDYAASTVVWLQNIKRAAK